MVSGDEQVGASVVVFSSLGTIRSLSNVMADGSVDDVSDETLMYLAKELDLLSLKVKAIVSERAAVPRIYYKEK